MNIENEDLVYVILIILGLLILIYPQLASYIIGLVLIGVGILKLF